jgi:inosose dehydratase
MSRFKIACHLIQWAGEEKKDMERVLKEVADAGYEGVEGLWANSPEDLVNIGAMAGKLGLHVVNILSDDLNNRFKFNLTLGNRVAEIPPCLRRDYGGEQPRDEDYKRAAESIGKICDLARSYNIKPVHHVHLGTIIETAKDAELMLRYAQGLYLLLDTGHMTAANSNPVDIIQSYGDRIAHVHLKDVRARDPEAWKKGRGKFGEDAWFEELGKGNLGLDIPAVLEKLERIGYEGWVVVEQDHVTAHSPKETAKINRMYLKSLGY